MEHEAGTISIAIISSLILGFTLWIIKKINEIQRVGRFLGFNFKVSDVTMSIGIAQLSKRHVKIEHVKKIYNLYKNCIDKLDYIDLIPVNIKYEVPLYIEVVSKHRDKIIKYLKDKEIEIFFLPPSIHYHNI